MKVNEAVWNSSAYGYESADIDHPLTANEYISIANALLDKVQEFYDKEQLYGEEAMVMAAQKYLDKAFTI